MRVLVMALTFWLALAGATSAAPAEGKPAPEARKRVVLLNFIKGLHLTSEQQDSLVRLCELAQALERREEHTVGPLESRLERALQELEGYLARDAEIPDSLKREVHSVNLEIESWRAQFRSERADLEQRALALLTPNQLHVARTAKLCLIPPTQGAIGQDRGTVPKALERALKRLREVPDHRYHFVRERILARHLQMVRTKAPEISPDSLLAYEERLRVVLDDVRSMPEGEFLAELPQIAAQLRLEPHQPEREKGGDRDRRIARLLLDPLVPELLRIGEAEGASEEPRSMAQAVEP